MSRFSARRGRRPRVFVLAALVTLGACTDESPATAPRADVARALAPDPLAGDVITVTNASGGKDAGSLRWAVAQATGGEVIRFAPALAGATITLDSTLLVNAHATIEGPADRGITISAGGKGRVILVGSGATQPVTLRNLTITGGKVPDEPGAGITVVSSVILEHVTVTGNEAKHAAAIYQWGGLPSSVVIVNSTVSGNVTTGVWPATIQADGDITLINSTVANNTGGVSTFNSGLKTLWNSIVANNGGTNCSSTVGLVHIGRNLSDDAGCGEASVVLIGDPKLEALAANGGPTMTHALHPSSPALNAATSCSVDVDQRYVARDARCDGGRHHDRRGRDRRRRERRRPDLGHRAVLPRRRSVRRAGAGPAAED
jgi:hypothetical protein